MRTIVTAAALAAFATTATATEPVKLDDRQLDAVTAGWLVFEPLPPLVFEPFEPTQIGDGVFSISLGDQTVTGTGGIDAALTAFFAAF